MHVFHTVVVLVVVVVVYVVVSINFSPSVASVVVLCCYLSCI